MSSQSPRLGAFLGVFTPTMLTILGVIMYLRTGWVVSQVGLGGALAIVVIAHVITILTTLSMSMLATSMRVGVGGAYFLISRSFGLALGGAIGIPLYMSQALSVTLYAYGLAETFTLIWPGAPVGPIAGGIVLLVAAVAGRSTQLALRLQLPIMLLIAASIASLFLGVPWGRPQVPMFSLGGEVGFWAAFAVFFPAVTGILAGVSLSGDLEDPGRDIPRGALAAVLIGLVVYLLVPVALASAAPAGALEDGMIWTQVAAISWLVVPGMMGAILSSALGSILGAPRTLQALAQDGLVPLRFAVTDRDTGEPTSALRFTAVLAFAAVLLGDLNAVATVLTMFFLTTYAMLNIVAGTEALVHDPSFRPRFRLPWWASFAGAAGCVVAMLAISLPFAFAALAIEAAVFWTLRRRAMEATWGDVRTGVWYTAARWALDGLNRARRDPRNWRPHILLFAKDLSRSLRLVKLAEDLGQQHGIVTVTTLLLGDLEEQDSVEDVQHAHRALLDKAEIPAFPEVVCVPDFESGVITVAQANGFAGLASNTALFGWPDEPDGLPRLLRLSRRLATLDRCTMIARQVGSARLDPSGPRPRALVWWKGKASNGDLMLLMAHLLSLSAHWRGLRIGLRSIVFDPEDAVPRRRELESMLPDLRIDADVEVLVTEPERVRDTIHEHSAEAQIVFLGLPSVPKGEEEAYAESIRVLVEGLPTTVLVRNASEFRGRLV